MTDEISQSMKAKFLLAIPGLPDPNFAQTVTCMCEHNESGALGFIINKIHPLLTGRELFDDLKIECGENVDKLEMQDFDKLQILFFNLNPLSIPLIACVPL